MKRHLPWIGALLGVAGVLAGLHFVVFAPLKNDYDTVKGQLAESVESLKNEIGSIRWKEGKAPDPRKMGFSWKGLLEDSQGIYTSNLATYEDIVSRIDVSFVAPSDQEKTQIILDQIKSLQEMEVAAKGKLSVLEKWGLDTWNTNGYAGSRGLDLRWGGYRSYAGEDRIKGPQGTIQFAFNLSPWATTPEAFASRDPKTAQAEDTKRHVLFHAARQQPKDPNAPEGAPPVFSSEIVVERVGMNLMARVKTPTSEPFVKQVNLYNWLTGGEGSENLWKVIRVTWGPNPTDTNFYIDNKSADQINASMATRPAPAPGGGFGGGYNQYGGAGGGVRDYNSYGGGGGNYNPYGGGETGGLDALYGGVRRAGQLAVQPGFSLEPLDGFSLGADLQIENKAAVQMDAVRIWDQVAASGEPLSAPLFSEDFEKPFGSDEELARGMDQVVRFHENYFDPTNSAEVKEKYFLWYILQMGSAGLYSEQNGPDKGVYVYGMWLISWLDHVSKTLPNAFGDPDRIAQILTLPEAAIGIDSKVKESLVIFLGLAVDMAKGLIDAEVEKVESIQFLNWSHTINDEGLKAAFKDAFTQLQDKVKAGANPMMGMYGMGMGMGMYGGGYGGDPYGGGYGDPYGGGYGGGYGEEMSYSDTDDPEKIAKAKEAAKKRQEEAKAEMEKMMEDQRELKNRQAKLTRWTPFYNTNQVPPDYYVEYRDTIGSEGQQDFFLRYSMKTQYRTDRENLAKSLYNLEFGTKLAFLSQLSLVPDVANASKIDVEAFVEFNYMNDSGFGVGAESEEGGETPEGEAPLQSTQAPPAGIMPSNPTGAPGQG